MNSSVKFLVPSVTVLVVPDEPDELEVEDEPEPELALELDELLLPHAARTTAARIVSIKAPRCRAFGAGMRLLDGRYMCAVPFGV
jgi:hypothetical protein